MESVKRTCDETEYQNLGKGGNDNGCEETDF